MADEIDDLGDLKDIEGGDLEEQDEFEDLPLPEPEEESEEEPEEESEEEPEEDSEEDPEEDSEEEPEEDSEEEPEEKSEEESEEEEESGEEDPSAQIARQTIADLQSQLDTATRTNQKLVEDRVATELANVSGQMDSLQKDLEEAIEEGDASTQAEVQVKVTALSARKTQLEQHVPAEGLEPSTDRGPHVSRYPKANEYIALNSWVGDPAYPQQNKALSVIDKALFEEGYSPNEDEYYEQLASRLNRRFPNLMKTKKVATKKPKTKPKKVSTKPIISADRGKLSRKATKRKRMALDAEDRAVMQQFSLDPKDPDHRKMYLKNKNERLKNEARQSRG